MKEKKRFLYTIFIIFIVYICINQVINYFLYRNKELEIKRINKTFENVKNIRYNGLIIGNSRIYRGINPSKINIINFYNFAYDNDSFNQMYYKLLYVNQYKKIDYIIIGVDYFQFSFLADTRNYIYFEKFPKEYKNDFKENFIVILEKKMKTNSNNFVYFAENFYKILLNKQESNYKLEENGWYHEKINKIGKNEILKRESKILEVQNRYFYNIVKFCKQNNIITFLLMPPMKQYELDNYSIEVIKQFREKFKTLEDKNTYYLDYSEMLLDNIEYFEDSSHLNTNGANKLSEEINKDINNILMKNKFQKINKNYNNKEKIDETRI